VSARKIVQVALPVRLRRLFDYRADDLERLPADGARVLVPLQKRKVVGIVCGRRESSALPLAKLRRVIRVLDDVPLLPKELFRLLNWAARYYHHPLGDVMQTALPVLLRRDRSAQPKPVYHWRICEAGRQGLDSIPGRYRAQRRVLDLLAAADGTGLPAGTLSSEVANAATVLARLEAQGWAEKVTPVPPATAGTREKPLILNQAQQAACTALDAAAGCYTPFLLDGVTGSGKTEVYLDCVARTVSRGRQALVLVPEISLTPQLIARFQARLGGSLAVLHSGLTDTERHRAWWRAREGSAAVVLGTRSAVFAPLARPGVIVVDEEHDLSYKQREGFRYHARDIAVKRAQLAEVPVILGSATPSLESMANALSGRYRHLRLKSRAGSAKMPRVKILDLNRLAVNDGLSAPIVGAIGDCISRGQQSLVFVNRRGFAPVVVCTQCGWQALCRRCDARQTLHRRSGRVICHHCGSQAAAPIECPKCQTQTLFPAGEGTQRVEEALVRIFPKARVIRLDSDVAGPPEEITRVLQAVREREVDILVGTQMLSKGHDFAGVTLVCVLSADQGLYSLDFRGPERLFQQLAQVSGRAGRRESPGAVLVQTAHPESPAFSRLEKHDFAGFAGDALMERQAAGYPPYVRFALLRAESTRSGAPLTFLRSAALAGRAVPSREGVEIMTPVPSPMERRAGRYRAQLLVRSKDESRFHRFLEDWVLGIEESTEAARVRWSIDVDPQEMY
jgi:primosomal protein N' (replication factor Y)|tara:strand:+ start:7055 stop:9259 length:2205 start_codon:yes stop_codon:yes gene_type:complete